MIMANWRLFDYLDVGGYNDFENWSEGLQKPDLARLNRKLKMLEDNGPNLGTGLLAGPIKGYAHIYKLKINGRVALRPLLCKGPIDNEREFTLLMGAFEIGSAWQPPNARSEAVTRRDTVIATPKRRCNHVKVT
jgi:hypothetical protein